MKFDMYLPENGLNEAGIALSNMIKDLDLGVAYADMLRIRVSGGAYKESVDRYYVAHENGICYSRHWNGWGRHENAIGNFGHFFTIEEMRGKGIGKRLLEMWHEDLMLQSNKPLVLCCTAGERPGKMYEAYDFLRVREGANWGPMFMPLGNTPKNFRDLCDMYYEPSDTLICKKATLEWRHEIDCLLKFAFFDRGIDFDIGNVSYIEHALLHYPNDTRLIFTDKNRCVGWMLGKEVRLYPEYDAKKIQCCI